MYPYECIYAYYTCVCLSVCCVCVCVCVCVCLGKSFLLNQILGELIDPALNTQDRARFQVPSKRTHSGYPVRGHGRGRSLATHFTTYFTAYFTAHFTAPKAADNSLPKTEE